MVRHDRYVHSYPHCWRTDTHFIYRAVSSWFVKVHGDQDRMLELKQQITWVPSMSRDGSFGKWLEGAPPDLAISRNRFWAHLCRSGRATTRNHPRSTSTAA